MQSRDRCSSQFPRYGLPWAKRAQKVCLQLLTYILIKKCSKVGYCPSSFSGRCLSTAKFSIIREHPWLAVLISPDGSRFH